MTYSSGGLIQAADYNGFANDGANNVNAIWSTGSGDKGWGQTAITTVAAAGTVTATQWATLVANIATAGTQTSSTLTARTQPTAGSVISVLSNVGTDINTITLNRGNAAASGSISSTWTGSTAKTSSTGSGGSAWTITFTHTVTFADANSARYFFNAGGLIRLDYSKTSTGTDSDADWNTLAGECGQIYFSGRVNGASQTIAGQAYTGTTRLNGTGGTQTTLATTTGYYNLTAGAGATTLFRLTDDSAAYTSNYIQTTVALNAGSTVLTFVTTWVNTAAGGAGQDRVISGGTDTVSPFSSFGTAPTTLCRFVPPSTTYLTPSWGTPAVAAAIT
jgi:hypothetical protein